MKKMMALGLLCLLLPAASLAVTEGVVEPAPQVSIDWPRQSDALFGMWERGLEDIERAARQVLMERFGCPQDMVLMTIQVGDRMFETQLGTEKWQEESMWAYIYVNFLFEDARMGGTMSGQVGFDFETGRLGHCSLSRWYDKDDEPDLFRQETEGPGGLNAEQERAILDDYLGSILGFADYEITAGQNARLADGSRLHAMIGRKSHQVIKLSYSTFGEEETVQ